MPTPRRTGLMLHLSHYLPHISGLTLSAVALAASAVARGHAVTVATSRPKGSPAQERLRGVLVLRSAVWARIGKAPLMPGQISDLWRAMDNASVVSLQLPCADAGLAAVLARLRRRPVLITYHCSLSRETRADRIIRALIAGPHLLAGLLAERIQVVSEEYARQSTFCRIFHRKLHFAPPPMDLPHMPPRPAPVPGAPFRIGFVGRISRQKNLGMLIAALDPLAKRLPQGVELHIVGPAQESKGSAASLDGLWPHPLVRHCGVLSDPDLHAFYAGLDVLVLPSLDRQEAFGIVQVEAMLAGVPVVAFDLPGIREPIRLTGMGRLARPGDLADLVQAMADVLTGAAGTPVPPEHIQALFGPGVTCAMHLSHPALAPNGVAA